MNSTLAAKILLLLGIALFSAIVLNLIEGLVHERQRYQNEARESVATGWSRQQQITGPLLAIPYTVRQLHRYRDADKQLAEREIRREQIMYLTPERLEIDGSMSTQQRYKGVFGFPVYTAALRADGHFDLAPVRALRQREDLIAMGKPYLAVAITDIRGIHQRPELHWRGALQALRPGSRLGFHPEGIHAPLPPMDVESPTDEATFSLNIDLRGMDALWFTPSGKDMEVTLQSSWPHPGFNGQYLPHERSIDEQGFTARWLLSEFSSNTQQRLLNCSKSQCEGLGSNSFGVELTTPVAIYQQTIRSTKYGILFVGLTFIGVFLFETLRRLPVHPVQYTLVAMALSVFYLLLIALSEHIGFAAAYGIATACCSGLLALYIAGVIGSAGWALGFGGLVSMLFGVLYVILNSEDHALLLGAGLVFAALAGFMLSTRRLNWYQISTRAQT